MSPYLSLLASVLAVVVLCAPLPVASAEDPGHARLSLADGWSETGGARVAALVFDLDPGWKTYWRAPGEAGIPPSFDLSGSVNLANIEFLWPVPHVFETYGLRSLGFSDRLVLPVRLTPVDPAQPLSLAIAVAYGVCADICIPAEGSVLATFQPESLPGPDADKIATALASRPHSAEEAGVVGVACTMVQGDSVMDLTARVSFGSDIAAPDMVVVESPLTDLWIPPAAASLSGQIITAQTRAEWFGAQPLVIERSTLRLTLITGDRAVEITGCPAPQG